MQYRPRTLDDLVIHKEFGDSLKKLVRLLPGAQARPESVMSRCMASCVICNIICPEMRSLILCEGFIGRLPSSAILWPTRGGQEDLDNWVVEANIWARG